VCQECVCVCVCVRSVCVCNHAVAQFPVRLSKSKYRESEKDGEKERGALCEYCTRPSGSRSARCSQAGNSSPHDELQTYGGALSQEGAAATKLRSPGRHSTSGRRRESVHGARLWEGGRDPICARKVISFCGRRNKRDRRRQSLR